MSKLDDMLPKGKADTRDIEIADLRKRVDELQREKETVKEKPVIEPEIVEQKPKGWDKVLLRKPKAESKYKPDQNTDFSDEEKQQIFNKYTKGKKYTRRERNMLLNMERDNLRSTQWFILGLALLGVGFIFFLYQTTSAQNGWVVLVVLMLGSCMFLPAGMILGWAILDPYVRCKLLRRMTKKNYGIVNFLGKGNKMVSKIKNLDDALIWVKNKVWVITREHIYQLTKQGDDITEGGVIEPDNIISLIETVPVLFCDLDSMQPLTLAREGREAINPEELGSTLKSWADNQLAKAIMLKKTMDMYFVIMIICSIASCVIGYVLYTKIDELGKDISTIKQQLDMIISSSRNATGFP